MGQWDIEFAKRQRAAFEKAKAQLRWLVEQEQLRAGKPTPVTQAEASSVEVKNETEAKAPRRKKAARKLEQAEQAIKAKYPNGPPPTLSDKDLCASFRGSGMSDTTILRAAGRRKD